MPKEEIRRHAIAVEFATHLERGLEDQNSRGNPPSYLRPIGRHLRNEFIKNNSRWGIADTYDHTRRISKPGRDNGRRRSNDSYRTFPRNNRPNQRRVNRAAGDDVGAEEDNGDYFDGDWDNFGYQWDHPQSQVNFKDNDNNYAACEI